MGFKMSAWDQKLLKYGAEFEEKMMDLSVNIELIDALDLGWKILADNFDKGEVGIPSKLTVESLLLVFHVTLYHAIPYVSKHSRNT